MSINDFRYSKHDDEYNHYEKELLPDCCLPNVKLQQNEAYTEDYLFDSSQVVVAATRVISTSEELYASYCKTEFASPVQLNYNQKHSLFIRKTLISQSSVSLESTEYCV